MNCKECGRKIGVLNRIKVGDGYLCRNCYEKLRRGSDKWGMGIPHYKDDDLMTKDDFVKVAMDAVREKSLNGEDVEILEEHPVHGQIPHFICMRNNHRTHITVRPAVVRSGIRPLFFEEKKAMAQKASEDDALCYYADVQLKIKDLKRESEQLYLKGDDFETFYDTLREIRAKVSEEWIEETLKKISLLEPERDKNEKPEERIKFALSKTEPSKKKKPVVKEESFEEESGIRYSITDLGDSFWLSEFTRFNMMRPPQTFQQMLLDFINEKGMTNPEFYNAAMIDRKLFSAIKNNLFYKPKKETAVACCFGLKLSLEDAERLLASAGYKLSLSILWDRIIYFCLSHRITDLDIVNELLYREKQKCLGVNE